MRWTLVILSCILLCGVGAACDIHSELANASSTTEQTKPQKVVRYYVKLKDKSDPIELSDFDFAAKSDEVKLCFKQPTELYSGYFVREMWTGSSNVEVYKVVEEVSE